MIRDPFHHAIYYAFLPIAHFHHAEKLVLGKIGRACIVSAAFRPLLLRPVLLHSSPLTSPPLFFKVDLE